MTHAAHDARPAKLSPHSTHTFEGPPQGMVHVRPHAGVPASMPHAACMLHAAPSPLRSSDPNLTQAETRAPRIEGAACNLVVGRGIWSMSSQAPYTLSSTFVLLV